MSPPFKEELEEGEARLNVTIVIKRPLKGARSTPDQQAEDYRLCLWRWADGYWFINVDEFHIEHNKYFRDPCFYRLSQVFLHIA